MRPVFCRAGQKYFGFGIDRVFELFRIGHHLARGDLIVARADEAQLTQANAIVTPHRRTKDAARHRTKGI